VEDYFRERLDRLKWEEAFMRPQKPKLVTLVEQIEAAKKRVKE
jgi:hypothetical protein